MTMAIVEYTEEQLSPWISGTELPFLPGRYQVKQCNPPKLMTGVFQDGLWRLLDGLSVYPSIKPSSQLEWRGLNFEPKNEPKSSSGSFEIVMDWRGPVTTNT
jgi:hypothetical protein